MIAERVAADGRDVGEPGEQVQPLGGEPVAVQAGPEAAARSFLTLRNRFSR